MGNKIGYARIGIADHDPQTQLDALAAEGCATVYQDVATGPEAHRPQWQACLAHLRPGDTLIIWKIDRIGRSLHDLVDIVATLQARHVAVKSLTDAIIDTTPAPGKLAVGIVALLADHEEALLKEHLLADLAVTRARAASTAPTDPAPGAPGPPRHSA